MRLGWPLNHSEFLGEVKFIYTYEEFDPVCLTHNVVIIPHIHVNTVLGSDDIYSQSAPACQPTATDNGWHSGRDTPEEPAAEIVAGHKGPRFESRDKPPAEFGDPPAQLVEERTVELDAQISKSRRPIAVEDDQTGIENSNSVCPFVHPEGNRSPGL
jgi:hypothetical protein